MPRTSAVAAEWPASATPRLSPCGVELRISLRITLLHQPSFSLQTPVADWSATIAIFVSGWPPGPNPWKARRRRTTKCHGGADDDVRLNATEVPTTPTTGAILATRIAW